MLKFTDLLDEYLSAKVQADRTLTDYVRTDDGDGQYSARELWLESGDYKAFMAAKNALNEAFDSAVHSKTEPA